MPWNDQIFRYCERGQDPSFWAEPLNAITNGAFLIAALAAAMELYRRPDRTRRWVEALLIALVAVIGIGSFLFHTYATRWAAVADTAPIGLFMVGYLVYALRRYLALNWIVVGLLLGGFIWSLQVAGNIQCRPGLLSVTAAARGPCLNGTVGYAPALFAMLGIGALLGFLRHLAWRYLMAAGIVFLVSMFFRTVDLEVCASTLVAGRRQGVHFLWHLLNATTLYILLLAAIRHGQAQD